jgi:hypothetical protein
MQQPLTCNSASNIEHVELCGAERYRNTGAMVVVTPFPDTHFEKPACNASGGAPIDAPLILYENSGNAPAIDAIPIS